MKNLLILGLLVGLTACATPTTDPTPDPTPDPIPDPTPDPTPDPLAAASANLTAAIAGTVIAGDVDGTAVAISIGGTPLTSLTRKSVMDNGVFAAARMDVSNNIGEVAFSGTSASGAMTATMAGDSNGSHGVTYARTSQTTLPTSGTGNFAGDYVGIFGDPTAATASVRGDASLTADFAGSTISGAITNRVLILADGSSPDVFADVTLASTAIDANGAYSGAASGGSFNGATLTSNDSGVYQGLIGGTNGTETAGGLEIVKTYNTTQVYTETGAFIAD